MNAAAKTSAPETLVYGIGNTGLSVARYLRSRNVDALYVDSRAHPPGLEELGDIVPDAQVVVGALSPALLENVSTMVVSPGIADNDDFLAGARRADIDIVSDIEVFTRSVSADFVAVTGTNGKSTVTSLIAELCEACGLRVLAGANLGRPALDLLAEDEPDVYVLELSSFQLHRTAHLPAKVAVLLNVTADHLDWHGSEAQYVAAKHRIYREAKAAVVNRDDPVALNGLPAGVPAVSFGLGEPGPADFGVIDVDGRPHLAKGREALIAADELALVGEHNCANALAALAVTALLVDDLLPALEALRRFSGLPHRMQRIADRHGVRYINDSKATNVAAAIASVRSLSTPVILLAGGQGKGGDFDALARDTASLLKAVIVFGEDAAKLERAYRDRAAVRRVPDLAAAVDAAREMAASGDTVLLAPACASFDQFDNYGRRGDVFAELVEAIEP